MKENKRMKTLNHLLITAVAAFWVNAAFATTAPNTALLHSPRYVEAHPELLRGQTSGGESKKIYQSRLTENIALANSPRFREAHPELRREVSSQNQSLAVNASETERLNKLTENRALAASPRFVEQHPELRSGQRVFEVAPLK